MNTKPELRTSDQSFAPPIEAAIAKHPCLAGLTETQLHSLIQNALRVRFEEDELIFSEGDPANRFYLIETGKASLEKHVKDGPGVQVRFSEPVRSWDGRGCFRHTTGNSMRALSNAIFFYGTRLAGTPPELGAAERILCLIRKLGPLVGWSRSNVRAFLQLSNAQGQISYWHQHLNTKAFRTALNLLFTFPTLRSVYSSALLNWLPPHLGAVMRARMERCIGIHSNHENPDAYNLLSGPNLYGEPVIRSNVQLECADAASFLERQPAGSFGGFALSNILDGAKPAYAKRLASAIKRSATSEAVTVLRSFREPIKANDANLASEDRSMLWGIVNVQPAREFSLPWQAENPSLRTRPNGISCLDPPQYEILPKSVA